MQICSDHLSARINHIPIDIDEFIINHLYERVSPAVVVNLVKKIFNTTLTQGDLYKYRNKVLYTMLDNTVKTPHGTPIDKLIHYFSKKKDDSFMYVIHDMDSGFFTYRKNKSDTSEH